MESVHLVVGNFGPANHPTFEVLKRLMSRFSTSAFKPPEIIFSKINCTFNQNKHIMVFTIFYQLSSLFHQQQQYIAFKFLLMYLSKSLFHMHGNAEHNLMMGLKIDCKYFVSFKNMIESTCNKNK